MRSFLKAILEKDPDKRLGCHPRPESDIRDHVYFTDLDWDHVEQKRIRPSFVPPMKNEKDPSNFDRYFTNHNMSIKNSFSDGPEMTDFYEDEFRDFSFYNPDFE